RPGPAEGSLACVGGDTSAPPRTVPRAPITSAKAKATAKDSVTIPNQGRVTFMRVSACFRLDGCTPTVCQAEGIPPMLVRKRGATGSGSRKQGLSYSRQSSCWMGSRGWLRYYRARVSFAAAEFARYGVSCRHLGSRRPRVNDLGALLEQLRTAGVQVDSQCDGRFALDHGPGWSSDRTSHDGNRRRATAERMKIKPRGRR